MTVKVESQPIRFTGQVISANAVEGALSIQGHHLVHDAANRPGTQAEIPGLAAARSMPASLFPAAPGFPSRSYDTYHQVGYVPRSSTASVPETLHVDGGLRSMS